MIADGSQDLFPKAGRDVGRESRTESHVNPDLARKQPLTEPRKPLVVAIMALFSASVKTENEMTSPWSLCLEKRD